MQLTKPLFLGFAALITALSLLAPLQQDTGTQVDVFSGATITTTTQTEVVACGQGSGAIGRKTLVVENASGSSGVVTVTAELRTASDGSNFTSGYMALNGVTTNTLTSTTTTPTSTAGRFCAVSAVSASTSTVTVTLRKE